MSTNIAHTAEVQDAMDTAPRANRVGSADVDSTQVEACSSASKSGSIGRGIFSPIRAGLLAIVEILSQYRSLMAEIDTMDRGNEQNDTVSPRS